MVKKSFLKANNLKFQILNKIQKFKFSLKNFHSQKKTRGIKKRASFRGAFLKFKKDGKIEIKREILVSDISVFFFNC